MTRKDIFEKLKVDENLREFFAEMLRMRYDKDSVNELIPSYVSAALATGRHTTTHAELYHLDRESRIIDSPGMQEFGLHHIKPEDAAQAFVEFRPWLGQCRFRDCRHVSEPDCAVAAAVERGEISARRLASYRKFAEELNRKPVWD